MRIITFVQTLASDAEFTSSLHPCPDFRNLQRRRLSVWFLLLRTSDNLKDEKLPERRTELFFTFAFRRQARLWRPGRSCLAIFPNKKKVWRVLEHVENRRQYKKMFFSHGGRISIKNRHPEFTFSCSFSCEQWTQVAKRSRKPEFTVILSNSVPGSFLLRLVASENVQVSCRHGNCVFHSHIFPGFPGHSRRLPSSLSVWVGVKASDTSSSECLSCELHRFRVSSVKQSQTAWKINYDFKVHVFGFSWLQRKKHK